MQTYRDVIQIILFNENSEVFNAVPLYTLSDYNYYTDIYVFVK